MSGRKPLLSLCVLVCVTGMAQCGADIAVSQAGWLQ